MQDQDLIKLLEPINQYIANNNIQLNDIPVIVLNHFPSEEQLKEISTYLHTHLREFKNLSSEKMFERTRQILQKALEKSAIEFYYNKIKISDDKFSTDEINEELGDYELDDNYDKYTDERYEDYD